MSTDNQELLSLLGQYPTHEAGVADLMELYEKIEGIYVISSAQSSEIDMGHTTNSTNVSRNYADLGQDSHTA